MKLFLKYKILILTIIILSTIGYLNVKTLSEVSKAEDMLNLAKQKLEDKEKELDKKIIFYDKKLNLSKIKENMEKKGMTVADNIIFFEIEKN